MPGCRSRGDHRLPTDRELLDLKDRAAATLLAIPSVTAVGIGGRWRDGAPTGELVLKVYVEEKRPAAEVPPDELVPAQFEGLPTDVERLAREGIPSLAPPGALTDPEPDEARRRPLIGGCRLEVALSHGGWGTLGCLLVDPDDPDNVYALTNWHVLAGHHGHTAVKGTTRVGQPTKRSSRTKCCSGLFATVAAGSRDALSDAGVAQLEPGSEWLAEVLQIGAIKGPHPLTSDDVATGTYAIRMRGARSGLTGGILEAIGVTRGTGTTARADLIIVRPNPNPKTAGMDPETDDTDVYVGQHGDSGAAYVNDANEVVGIHVTHDEAGADGLGRGAAIPIEAVFTSLAAVDHLAVEVATADETGDVQEVQGAAMVVVPRELSVTLAPTRVAIAPGATEVPEPTRVASLQRDLDRSETGRSVLTLWLEHQDELLALVNTDRRVTVAWHRSGAAALFQRLIRMLSDPQLALPTSLHDHPLSTCLDRLCTSIGRAASPQLRRDLEATRRMLPDLGGLTYDGIQAALGAAWPAAGHARVGPLELGRSVGSVGELLTDHEVLDTFADLGVRFDSAFLANPQVTTARRRSPPPRTGSPTRPPRSRPRSRRAGPTTSSPPRCRWESRSSSSSTPSPSWRRRSRPPAPRSGSPPADQRSRRRPPGAPGRSPGHRSPGTATATRGRARGARRHRADIRARRPGRPRQPDHDRLVVHLDRLVGALTNPVKALEASYGWGSPASTRPSC